MAITNQGELVAAVQNWNAGHANLTTTRCAELIALAESRLNRDLDTTEMVTKNAAFSITGEYVAIPTGMIEVLYFETTTGGQRYALEPMGNFDQGSRYGSTTGIPKFYIVQGANFRFAPIPDATYTATLAYRAVLTALGTTSGNTNWLITSYPDLYLYATLLQGAAYLQADPAQIAIWEQAYRDGIAGINKMSKKREFGGPPLTIRPS